MSVAYRGWKSRAAAPLLHGHGRVMDRRRHDGVRWRLHSAVAASGGARKRRRLRWRGTGLREEGKVALGFAGIGGGERKAARVRGVLGLGLTGGGGARRRWPQWRGSPAQLHAAATAKKTTAAVPSAAAQKKRRKEGGGRHHL
uniref:Uncharacterized protein n=1 Tax=Oryza punctata TaxID=4537 RepID=A0A0E0L3P4_ORYPU